MEGRRNQARRQAFVGGHAGRRTTGLVALAANTIVDSFAAILNGEPAAMRKMMTYDQGR